MIYERKKRAMTGKSSLKRKKGIAHGKERVGTNFIISLWYGRCKCMRLDILFWIYCCSCFHFFVNWMYWYLGFHFFVKWIYCFLQFLCLWIEYIIATCNFFACELSIYCYLWFHDDRIVYFLCFHFIIIWIYISCDFIIYCPRFFKHLRFECINACYASLDRI